MTQRNNGIRYVQGMNVLAAPFLYVCGGEAECMAFGLFERFITVECPVYLRPTLEGVHRGLKVPAPIENNPYGLVARHLSSQNRTKIVQLSPRQESPS
jgi:Rab-GTPase-TBC domain